MFHLNIRLKILIVFMLLFTIALAVFYYWFYQFTTNRTIDEIRQSLMTSARTAASLVDANELIQVFNTGVEEDTQYTHIANQLRLVRDANPKVAAIYTLVRSDDPDVLIFVVSADENPETRAHLHEPYDVSEFAEMKAGFDGQSSDKDWGADEFGVWLSGYAPIRDADGQSIAIVGVDIDANDLLDAQAQVKKYSLIAFALAIIGVLIASFVVSGSITKRLTAITSAALTLEKGEPYKPEQLVSVARGKDELGHLARMFNQMAEQVQSREQKLKQEVAQLKIEVDHEKRAHQVDEITNTEYFQSLQKKAKEMRGKKDSS